MIAFLRTALCFLCISSLAVRGEQPKPEDVRRLEEILRRGRATQGLVVKTLRTRFDISDAKSAPKGTIETMESLSGWDKGKPQRKETLRKVTGKPGLFIRFSMGFEDKPEESLELPEVVRNRTLEHTPEGEFEVFDVGDQQDTWAARMWIQASTGLIARADYLIRKPSIIGVKALEYTIWFAQDSAGRVLPKSCEINATGSLLFVTRKAKILQEYLEWTARSSDQ